jgi:hypothetical protein
MADLRRFPLIETNEVVERQDPISSNYPKYLQKQLRNSNSEPAKQTRNGTPLDPFRNSVDRTHRLVL